MQPCRFNGVSSRPTGTNHDIITGTAAVSSGFYLILVHRVCPEHKAHCCISGAKNSLLFLHAWKTNLCASCQSYVGQPAEQRQNESGAREMPPQQSARCTVHEPFLKGDWINTAWSGGKSTELSHHHILHTVDVKPWSKLMRKSYCKASECKQFVRYR